MGRKFSIGIDLMGQRAQNLASATQATDAPNWGQVMSWVNGLSWKNGVRAASTGNVSLATPGSTMDNIALSNGDRILLKNQITASQNGLYTFNGASSALTRTPDGIQGELGPNSTISVAEGLANADTGWTLTTNAPITIDTTALTFVPINANQTYTPGLGLLLSNGTFSIDTSSVVRKVVQNVGDGSSLNYVITHNLGTQGVSVVARIAATGEKVECEDFAPTVNTVSLTFGTAPSLNQYIVQIMG